MTNHRSVSHRAALALVVGLLAAGAAPAQAGDGLTVSTEDAWPSWRFRVTGFDRPGTLGLFGQGADLSSPQRLSLLADYDLGTIDALPAYVGGRLRATSGLVFGRRSGLDAAAPAAPASLLGGESAWPSMPYLGMGYTGWLPGTGLRFSADLGLTASFPGSGPRLGQAAPGGSGWDTNLRDLRLQPRIQLGVQYSY